MECIGGGAEVSAIKLGKRMPACEHCKRARRKCILPEGFEAGVSKCERCERTDTECVVVNPLLTRIDNDEMQRLINEEFEKLSAVMSELEDGISILSRSLSPTRESASRGSHSWSSRSSMVSEIEDKDDERVTQVAYMKKQRFGMNHEPPRSIIIRSPDGRLLQWFISPTRQGLSILTNLQSLEEMSQFTRYGWQAYTRPEILDTHLSDSYHPQFSKQSTGAVLRLSEGKSVFSDQHYRDVIRNLDRLKHPAGVDHEAVQTLEPGRRVTHLLRRFFNSTDLPLIHEPTFWKRYRDLKDPMQSGLVMAICALAMLEHWYEPNTFGDRTFSHMESSRLWEYYASCARELAAEGFDDISLEALQVNVILLRFCRGMQRVEVARGHAVLGLRIGYAVKSKYFSPDRDTLCATLEVEKQEWLRCMWTILEFNLWQIRRKIEPVMSREDLWAQMQETPCIQVLQDEPDRTRWLISCSICVITLLKTWLIPNDAFTQELLTFFVDDPQYASIDLGLKVERDLLGWYHGFPDEIKYTAFPLQSFSTEDMVQQAATHKEIQSIIIFWSLWISFHFRFLPSDIGSIEDPRSTTAQFLRTALETCTIAAKNILSAHAYVLEHFNEPSANIALRLACDVNWFVTNIEGMDKTRVRSAKEDVLTAIFMYYRYFRRLDGTAPSPIEGYRFEPGDSESFLARYTNNQQAEDKRKLFGLALPEREFKSFSALLQDRNIQSLLKQFAEDLNVVD